MDKQELIENIEKHIPEGLKPLPSVEELEKELKELTSTTTSKIIAQHLHSKYGTPTPNPSLPSVEELRMDILNTWGKPDVTSINELAQYIANKYALHPREWWKDCERFVYGSQSLYLTGYKVMKNGEIYLHSGYQKFPLSQCTPYTAPTADDIIKKHNLTEEEINIIKQS